MNTINSQTTLEMIAELKNRYNYANLKPDSYYKNSIKALIITRILRSRHHYFYVAYDTLIAILTILLFSMFGYWVSDKTSFVFIFVPVIIFVVIAIGFFSSISTKRREVFLKEYQEHF